MTDAQPHGQEPTPSPRRRRMLGLGAIAAGVIALVVVLIVATGGSDDELSANADSTSTEASTSTTTEPTDPPTTRVASTDRAVADTDASDTTIEATTTSIADTTTSVTEPTTTVIETTTTAAPVTSPVTAPPPPPTVSDDPAANCTIIGSLSAPTIGTEAKIIREARQFDDGLLCGNHRADRIEEGVDVLPGFASFEDSLAGGDALIGKVPAIIFGHRNSHNRPFHRIDTFHEGDPVTVTYLDGTTIEMHVVGLQLLPLKQATQELLAPSADGTAEVRLVACSHADGTPGGINYRWVATLVRMP